MEDRGDLGKEAEGGRGGKKDRDSMGECGKGTRWAVRKNSETGVGKSNPDEEQASIYGILAGRQPNKE